MKIYGVALLAFCFLLGKILGSLLGALLGVNSDVGGVGFAMILLIAGRSLLKKKGLLAEETKLGVLFWSSMYIPIVIAMAASQNVNAALDGGLVAILAGGIVTISGLFLVPLISRIGKHSSKQTKPSNP